MKFLNFQVEDLARCCIPDGVILGWSTGLGKTIGLYGHALIKLGWTVEGLRIKPNGSCLLVVPGDLHAQTIKEGLEKFKVETVAITCQEDFERLVGSVNIGGRPHITRTGRPIIPPGFYIVSYTQLTSNGVAKLPDPAKLQPETILNLLSLREDPHVVAFYDKRATHWKKHYERLGIYFNSSRSQLDRAFQLLRQSLERSGTSEPMLKLLDSYETLTNLVTEDNNPSYWKLTEPQRAFVTRAFLDDTLEKYQQNNGNYIDYPIGPIPAGYNKAKPETDTREKWRVRCLYSPSMADLSYDSFDWIGIDEGVKMKGEDTAIGRGIRTMDPKYRVIASATPIKNRLSDIFRLAWWAAGGKIKAHPLWPYDDDSAEREQFAQTFMVAERNVSKEQAAEDRGDSGKRFRKLTPEVCFVHKLWKLFSPLIIWRRKQDAGLDIVKMIRNVIRVEMGTLQHSVYQYHLQAEYIDCNEDPAPGAKLQALRLAAADPASDKMENKGSIHTHCRCTRIPPTDAELAREQALARAWVEENHPDIKSWNWNGKSLSATKFDDTVVYFTQEETKLAPRKEKVISPNPNCPCCSGRGKLQLPHISPTSYIPKIHATLSVINDILARKEQVVVFSAFLDPLTVLAKRLQEADINYVKLDGGTTQKKRGELAGVFKRGRYTLAGGAVSPLTAAKGQSQSDNQLPAIPVMLAGVECMSEGHSFHLANNVVLICYSWAYDKFVQALNRVYRLNSPKDVNVYVILAEGTVDRKLESMVNEKGDSADLVLDGSLMGEKTEEVNFAELLNIARKEFNADTKTIDEEKLEREWPSLCDQLRVNAEVWTTGAPVFMPEAAQVKTAKAKRSAPKPQQPQNQPDITIEIIKEDTMKEQQPELLPTQNQTPKAIEVQDAVLVVQASAREEAVPETNIIPLFNPEKKGRAREYPAAPVPVNFDSMELDTDWKQHLRNKARRSVRVHNPDDLLAVL